MSYLMKALEKAEQERAKQQEKEAGLKSGQQAAQASLPMGLVAMVVGVLVVAIGSTIWMGRDSTSDEDENIALDVPAYSEDKAQESNEADADQSSSLNNRSASEAVSSSDVSQNEAAVVQSIDEAPQSEPVVIEAKPARVYDLVELDVATINRLPTIRFQGHIYSSAAEYRTVQINDRTLSEGSLIAAGVQLVEITTEGIVISVGNKRVSLPKGQDWIAPQ